MVTAFAQAPRTSAPKSANPVPARRASPPPSLQRIVGNRQYSQDKLQIGQRGDSFEREADRVAEQFSANAASARRPAIERNGATPNIQSKCLGCAREDDRGIVQLKPLPGSASSSVAGSATPLGSGRPLPQAVRQPFENHLGYSFDRVRIHTDANAAASARRLRSHAYTSGAHIVFGRGEYSPQTLQGRSLLAHELTHVVQQGADSGAPDVQRAETDEEVGCGALVDCTAEINAEVNRVLTAAVAAAGSPVNADKVVDDVADDLGGKLPVSPIENWAETSLPAKKIHQPAKSATRYAGVNTVLWSIASRVLGPHVKIGSTCVGTDKLGHFFQQGYQYFQIARRASGGTVAAAEASGRDWEMGRSGLRATGVFSNADLQANRDGLQFYDDLKAKPTMTFDIGKYANANWNEQARNNYYETSTASMVWNNLLANYPWSGFFENSFTGVGGTPIDVDFSAAATGGLQGTYEYTLAGAKTKGKLSNIAVRQRTTTVTGTTGFLGANTATPVSGIDVTFDWTEGGSTGLGEWSSVSERTLDGKWGRGTSRNNGGLWMLSRG